MIDIHSHVLPFVDDGSQSYVNSFEMLRRASAQDVTDIIITPHFRSPYLYERATLIECFNEFKRRVEDEGINISLYLGQEIRINKRGKEQLQAGELLTLNGTGYLLVEFSLVHRSDTEDIVDVVYGLKKQGYIPVVAHLERYAYVDLVTAQEIKRVGGLVQVNAGSIVGENGFWVKRKANALLKEGLVDLVASDIHDSRKYLMAKANKIVGKKFGEAVANDLFINNAKKIIEG